MKLKIINFLKDNKKELIIVGIIILIGAFFRLYKISSYMTFLGDEGRDVIIVRRIFTELHPPLIGPGTSVGNMYLGPLYYYMMAIPLLLAGFSPVGPAVMIALLGALTIAFVWWVGRTWFNKTTGVVAATLYAISPTIIYYSRSSWNPNIMPFFALLCIYSIWKVWRERKFNWLIVLGISFAFVLQSHYLGLLLIPTLFIFWLLTFIDQKKKRNLGQFIQKSIIGAVGFVVLMSPLFFFDLRHNFINAKAIYKFYTERQFTFTGTPLLSILKIPQIFNLVNTSLLAGKNSLTALLSSVVVGLGAVYLLVENFVRRKNIKIKSEIWLLISWMGFGLLGFGIYKQSIYDHYFGFLFAVPFLLIGVIISKMLSGKLLIKIIGIVFFLYLIVVNLIASPIRKDPNRLLGRSIDVSKVIEENSGSQPFNLAVIADTNYEDGYEYFLLKDRYPVVDIDSQVPGTITNQLFVVCELLPTSRCDPTHSPKAQVANFGWSKIDSSWEVDGTIVYKLIHTK